MKIHGLFQNDKIVERLQYEILRGLTKKSMLYKEMSKRHIRIGGS